MDAEQENTPTPKVFLGNRKEVSICRSTWMPVWNVVSQQVREVRRDRTYKEPGAECSKCIILQEPRQEDFGEDGDEVMCPPVCG